MIPHFCVQIFSLHKLNLTLFLLDNHFFHFFLFFQAFHIIYHHGYFQKIFLIFLNLLNFQFFYIQILKFVIYYHRFFHSLVMFFCSSKLYQIRVKKSLKTLEKSSVFMFLAYFFIYLIFYTD